MEYRIDIKALQQITDTIFDHIINDLKIEKVEIRENRDFYWEVPYDLLYSVKDNQPKLDVGRLRDDWEFLKPLLKDNDQAVGIMLIHLAPLLRQLGQEVGQ